MSEMVQELGVAFMAPVHYPWPKKIPEKVFRNRDDNALFFWHSGWVHFGLGCFPDYFKGRD